MKRTSRPRFLVSSVAILVLAMMAVVSYCVPVKGRTLPLHGEKKPDEFVIFLPFADDVASHMSHYSYGHPGSAHLGVKYYAIDFNLGRREVYPIAKGRVIYADWNSSYGNVVVIEHSEAGFPGYVSVYAHLETIYPYGQLGQEVDPNHPIGVEGKTGDANNVYHLHFELRRCSEVPYGGLPSNDTSVCKSVVPEPFVGRHVYEGFGWWHEVRPLATAEGASRPVELVDRQAPNGEWEVGATSANSSIIPGKAIVFYVRYWDGETEIGEVRLTAGYMNRNWTTWMGDGFVAQSVWRIVARCDPREGPCGANRWRLAWDPYGDCIWVDGECKQYEDIDGYLPIPWLPKPQPIQPGEQVDICISFDIFDVAGNPMYAPAGVQCISTEEDAPLAIDLPQVDIQARRIHVLPYNDNLPFPDSATFVADITIPDGTVVTPGQALHKVWRVRNTGTSTWGSGYQLAFVGGDQMGAPAAVDVSASAPGAEVDVAVDMTAPSAQGSYAGYWQLRNAQGTYFGPRLWIAITVQSASSYVTILSADPPSPSDTAMVRIHARSEGMPNFRAMRLKVDGEVIYELGAPEFYYDWNTANYAAGDHSLVVEAADQSDTSWSHPERRPMSYTLLGNTQPLNHRPNPPSPTSPNDWYVYYSGNTAQLCAQHNGDPDGDAITGYYFDVYESAQLWNSGWVGSNCVTTGALGPYNYQWRVKVRDSNGAESDWSDTWHFTLVNPDLAITEFYFEPLDPDSEQVKIRACTAGQAGIGITMRVSVNDASDGSDSGQWHIIKELGVHCFNDEDAPVWRTLDYGDGPHRVRVEAHGVNTGWEGAAVQERTYTLPHRRPASPQLLRPVVASDFGRTSWLNSRTVGFAWQDTLRANQYRLCASLDSDACVNPILDVPLDGSTTQYTHTFDQDYWPLHWRIDASNDRGSTSSGTAHMGIDRTSPACAVQALPPVVYESVFQVSWSGSDDASGVASFDVEYMDSERGTWSEWLGGVPASRSYELFTGQPGHAYAFRCRATDNANNTSLYPEDSDTSTTVDPASRPPTPWWNNDYGQKRNVVILNNMSDATLPAGYPVLLRFDSSTSPSAAEIYNASLSSPKCNDLRIVYNDTTELDRAVQACSETKIEVWFRTSVSIPPGSSNPSSHQLYYGHAGAGSPPGSIATVFYPAVDSNTRVMLYSQEGSGQVVYDSSGYGNNCTFASDLLGWTTGKFGAHAVLFPGDPPDGPALNCGNNGLDLSAFTIEMFFKRNSLQPGIDWLAGQREAGAPAKYVLWLYGHQPQLEVWPCPGCTSSTANSNRQLADLERHHVAVSFDGNNQVRFYIDGVLDSVRTLNFGGWTPSSAHLQIGSGDILRRFSGDISFFRLSNNVRTDFSYGTFVSLKNEPTAAAGEVVQPPEAGSADLALAGMTAYPNPMGGALVQAVVVNQGDRATQNGFYTDLYVDNQPTGPDDFAGSIRFWVNDPIEPGVTVTLTTVLTDVVGLAGRTQTEPLGESTVALYSQTDSEGLVGEPDDQNNISSGLAVCVASPDQYEEDNTATAAKWIEMDSAQSHNFDRLADQDWLKFGAQAGKTYVLSTSDLGAAGDTYLYLYDTDQTTLLAANDDYGGSLASRIEWTAPAPGMYFVLVKHWNPNVGGCGTMYDVSLSVALPNTLFLPLATKNLCPAPSVLPDYPIGDINHDCSVGLADLLFVTSSMDSECGDPAYDSKADLNADCVIDALDIAILQEHWGEICLQYPIGDINRDCSVNAVDWAYLTSHVNANWGDPGYDSSCDLNRDCTIDEVDMEIMQDHWGETCP